MSKGVALVTGGGRRIGARICATLIEEGWYVIVHARTSVDDAQVLLDEASKKANGEARGEVVKADLSSDEGLAFLIDATKSIVKAQNADGLGVLVHNASIYN